MKSIIVQVQRLNFAMQSKNLSQTTLEKASRVLVKPDSLARGVGYTGHVFNMWIEC